MHLIHWICKSWEEAGWEGGELTRPSSAAFAPDCLKFQLDVGPSGRPLCDTNPQSFRCHSALAAPFVKGPLNQIDTIYSISLFIHMYAAPRFDKRLLSRGEKITTWHFKARLRTLDNNTFGNDEINKNKKNYGILRLGGRQEGECCSTSGGASFVICVPL